MGRVKEALDLLDDEYKEIKSKSKWTEDDIKRINAVGQAYNRLKEYTNTSPNYKPGPKFR